MNRVLRAGCGFLLLGVFLSSQGNGFAEDGKAPAQTPEQALIEACRKGDVAAVDKLLDQGLSPEATDDKGTLPLAAAAYEGKTDIVKELLKRGAKVDTRQRETTTALMLASRGDHAETTEALLDAGADVNARDEDGGISLMNAAWHGNMELLQRMVAAGAKVNTQSKGTTSLLQAVIYKRLDAAHFLLDHGADPDLSGSEAPTEEHIYYPPLYCAVDGGNEPMVRLLLQYHADPNKAFPLSGWTPLMEAASNQDKPVMAALIEAGADPDQTERYGLTALEDAGSEGKTAAVEFLRKHGARRTEVHVVERIKPEKPLPPDRAWALAMAAPYFERDGMSHGLITGGATVDPDEEKARLKKMWGVTDKKSVLDKIAAMRDGEQRKKEIASAQQLSKLPAASYNAMLDKIDEPGKARTEALLRNYRDWDDRLGLSWDLFRAVNLAVDAHLAGYLTEDEVWDLVLPMARQLQGGFHSWKEASENFLDAREIWAGERDPAFFACVKLLCDPKETESPWNQLSWDTDLGAKNP